MAAVVAAAAEADRQYVIQQVQAQIAAAKQVLQDAESRSANAQVRLQDSLNRLQQAAFAVDQAVDRGNPLLKELLQVEREILEDQGAGTPYAQTKQALNIAKQQLAAAKAQLIGRPEVKKDLADLKGAELTNATNRRLETFPAYAEPNLRLKIAGNELERIRLELFRSDPEWRQLNDDLNEARRQKDLARGEVAKRGLDRIEPLEDYRVANQAAAAARAAISRGENLINSLKTNSPGRSPKK